MKFTDSWLKEHLDTTASLEEICDALTSLGLVVDKVENPGEALRPFKIAEIVEAGPHPDADRLNLCQVNTGTKMIQVVCGDKSTRAGMKVVLALPGDKIPSTGDILKVGKVRGLESQGMMCSASELGLAETSEGILDLPADAPVGLSFADYTEADDPFIEIEITPNRGDALGVYGVARDLAAKLSLEGKGALKPLALSKPARSFPSPIQVTLDEAVREACPLFAGCVIRGVKNGPSPEWLQKRLRSIGLKPISTLVDITNFMTFDRGRPLHVFDADKITGDLNVRFAKEGETLMALDDKEYTLSSSMVVIADGAGAQSLGGIMGGLTTGCDEKTTSVFLEAAFFDPITIAKAGRALGILSDARYRFERYVDPETLLPGLNAATQMILDLCGGETSEIVLVGQKPSASRTIAFDPTLVASRGGVEMESQEAQNILESLGFTLKTQGALWEVTTPSWRPDVEGPADLVEEILRVHGYEHIPSTPFFVPEKMPPLTPLQRRRYEVRDALAGRGLTEVVTWSFVSEKKANLFGGVKDELKLLNPISAEMAVMRPSILPNLLDGALQNINRGQKTFTLFEVGPQYENNRPEGQHLMATAILLGDAQEGAWSQKARSFDFYDALAEVEHILGACGLSRFQLERGAPAWYHPGRSATLKQGNNILATVGELHPQVVKDSDLKRTPVAFEVFLSRIPAPKTKVKKAELRLSSYQAVEKDLAFIVDQGVPFGDVLKAAQKGAGPLLQDISLFDVFEGANLGEGKKSFAIRLLWQPLDKTLNDEDISTLMKNVIDHVSRDTAGVLRG